MFRKVIIAALLFVVMGASFSRELPAYPNSPRSVQAADEGILSNLPGTVGGDIFASTGTPAYGVLFSLPNNKTAQFHSANIHLAASTPLNCSAALYAGTLNDKGTLIESLGTRAVTTTAATYNFPSAAPITLNHGVIYWLTVVCESVDIEFGAWVYNGDSTPPSGDLTFEGARQWNVSAWQNDTRIGLFSIYGVTATCAIGSPELFLPIHRTHTTDTTPTFTWETVADAQSYRLMVYVDDRSFEYKKRVFNPTYTLTAGDALSVRKYLWRVRTQDSACGIWSSWSSRNTLFID